MADSPTIVAAALDDKQLKDSISNLVGHMKSALNTMTKDTDDAVSRMQKSLEKLGSLKIDSGGSADGGSSRRAKKQQEETQAVKETTQAHKELKMTLDQEASAMKRAMGGKKGIDYVTLTSDVDPNLTYLVNANRDVDKQLEEIIQKEQRLIEQKKQEATETQTIANAQQRINSSMSGESLWGANVHDMQRTSRNILSQQSGSTSISATNAEYTALENTIAKLLNIQVQELNLTTNANGAYVALNASLGQMTNAYREMTKSERDSAQGQELADKIQKTSKAIQDIQKQMNRPISLKSILDFEPKTLDDLQWKIRQLQAYKGGIDFTKPGAEVEVVKVDNAINRLTRDLNKYMGTGKRAQEINLALERSWSYMKNRLAFYFTVGASTAFVKNLARVRSEYEMNERALGVLINSAERGTQIFNQLSQMALVSPYTLIELSSAAKQLVAYDIAAKDVVDTTRRLADISAAVGVPVERFTYALGQVKAFGHLTSQDARQFLNTGVPLVKELSKYYTELEGRLISTADVYERMKKHAVSYNDVVTVLNKMTDEGGKFFDYQAKTADTLKVQLANLTLAWNNMLNDIGKQTQGILSGGIGLLRKIFLQWKSLDKAIMNTLTAFGVFKGIQALILLLNGSLATMDGWITLVGRKMTLLGFAAGKAFAAMATNPLTWVAVGITALVSLRNHYKNVSDAAREMNRELAENAKEAFSSLDEYLTSEGAKSARTAASRGQLGDEMAQKTWESIREEIELASIASDSFIAKLLEEEDLNKRVTMAFDVSDKIKEATSLLSGLNEEAFKVSQDSWLWGAFSEGLAEDLEDFIPKALTWRKQTLSTSSAEAGIQVIRNLYRSEQDEANREMNTLAKNLATTLRDRLGAEINDPVVLGEAIERFRAKIKEKNPQIQGEVAQWFDVKLDELLANEFENATLASTSINKQFLTILREHYSHAFKNITEDILKEDARWKDDQMEAIKSAAKELKKTTLPEFHDTIDQMVLYMNSQDWRIRIVTEMGITPSTAFQKEFDDRVKRELGLLKSEEYKYLRPTSEQDLYQWSTANLDSITKLRKERKAYETDNSTYSKNQLQRIDDEILARETLNKLFNQPTSKGGSGGGSKKDPLGDALAKEVQLIGEMQKRYNEYRQMGVNANTALTFATDEYGKSLARTNAVLNKFGIQTKTNNELAGMNLRQLRDYYQSLLAGATQIGNAKGIEAIEKAIANLNVEITKLDYKKITEGLNSELGKLKDEYELAVELDANPELGEAFLDMFGIDSSTLSSSIDDYMEKVQWAFNKAKDKFGYKADLNVFLADEKAWKEWGQKVGLNGEALEKFKSGFVNAQGIVKKWTEDTVKQTKDLQYKLADINDKIAFEKTKLANLENRLAKETNDYQKKLLEEQIKDQKLTIAKLEEEILEMLPTYKKLFGNLADHSAFVTRRLAANYQKMLKNAKQNADGTYTVTDPQTGKSATLTKKRYEKELDRANGAMLKAQTIAQKIGEAFTKGEDDVIDFAEGISLLGDEFGKMGDLVGTIGNIAESLGANENTVEIINDISTSMQGLGTASQGISKIMNGDVIGGLTDVVKGLWDAISTWFDNSDKKILRKIEESENSVKDLELAYKDLEYAMNKAYGTAEIQAKQLVITNKELQLAELERQLALQESRKSKNRDEEAIRDLKGQIKDLKNDIKDSVDDIVNSLLGISGVGAAVENMVSVVTEALRNGEDAMESWNDSIDEMIVNMIKKFAMTNYLGPRFQKVFDDIQKDVDERSKPAAERLASAEQQLDNAQKQYDKYSRLVKESGFNEVTYHDDLEKWRKKLEEAQREYNIAQEAFATASGFTRDDLRNAVGNLTEFRGEGQGLIDFMNDLLGEFGLLSGQNGKSDLSALQQGIQSITEDTANAIEAYLNGISQQVYLHSDLLTQIRDAVVSFDFDTNLGVMSQILLQLQSSYQVQMSIQGILEGVLNPSGQAFKVEMV